MRKLHFKILKIIIIFCGLIMKSQSPDGTHEYIPKLPTPEMASLVKFIETPVSLNKGIPTIDVPLYEIKLGSYSLPITLNYHAGGIKVSDVATWVGLGWNLSNEGTIIRQQRGNPDEYYFFYKNSVMDYYNDYYNQKEKRDAYLDYGYGDYEADIFSISFGNISGKFFFDQISQEFIDGTGQKIKITFKTENNENFWEIKDNIGNTYTFKHILGEKTETVFTKNGRFLFDVDDRPKGNDIWRITKIRNKEGKDIIFEYESNGMMNRYFLPETAIRDVNVNNFFNIHTPCNNSMPDLSIIQYNTEYSPASLKKINFDDGYVKFIWYDSVRPDTDNQHALKSIELYNSGNILIKKYNFIYSFTISTFNDGASVDLKYKYRMYLDEINIQNPNDPTDIQLYRKFSYLNRENLPSRLSTAIDYWGGFNNESNNNLIPTSLYNFKGLKNTNEKLLILGGNRRIETTHVMDGILNKIILPTKGEIHYTYEPNWIKADSLNQEMRSYFNIIDTEMSYFNKSPEYIVPNSPLKYQTKVSIPINNFRVESQIEVSGNKCGNSVPVGFNCDYLLYVIPDKDDGSVPTTEVPDGVLLQQAIFIPGKKYIIAAKPTDTETQESNFSVELKLINEIKSDKYPMGGVRIKKIEIKDGDTQLEKNYDYNYFNTFISSGKIQRSPVYHKKTYTKMKCYNSLYGNYFIDSHVLKIKSSPNIPLSDDAGVSIYYTNVTEYQTDLTDSNNNLKTEYSFSYVRDTVQSKYNSYNDLPVWSFSNMRGNLLNKKIYSYNKENSFYNLIQNEEYNYIYYDHNIPNYSIYWKDYTLRESEGEDYTSRMSTMYLTEKIVTEILRNQDVLTKIFYDYNWITKNKIQEDIIYNNESKKSILYKFATDKNNQYLIDKNIIGIPLETEVKKNDIVISKSYTHYPTSQDEANLKTSGLPLPYQVDVLNLKENELQKEITYDKYDNKGNLLQYTNKNGVPTVVIWGYYQTQPIAKIEGANYDDIASLASAIIAASDDDANQPPKNDESNFLNILAQFRQTLPNYQVSTYSYDPLIGVRSITPPSGITEYYFYDDANRLEYVKTKNTDGSMKVLKEYKYNYKH